MKLRSLSFMSFFILQLQCHLFFIIVYAYNIYKYNEIQYKKSTKFGANGGHVHGMMAV